MSDLFCFLDPKGYDLMILRIDGGGRMALWMSMGDGSGIIRAEKGRQHFLETWWKLNKHKTNLVEVSLQLYDLSPTVCVFCWSRLSFQFEVRRSHAANVYT